VDILKGMGSMKRSPLRLEILEDRVTPSASAYGFSWPDARHLSISFAPDGTAVGTQSSQLFQYFGNLNIATTDWQTAILRAAQSWAVNANLDFHVVSDNAAYAFGTEGATEGDTRFGDLRVGGIPLTDGLVSTAVPFTPVSGTWAGDILFSTTPPSEHTGTATPTTGTTPAADYDLYTLALHEVGHALGLATNLDPSSVMFAYYNGVRSGPSNRDIADLRGLYGPRTSDASHGLFDNHSLNQALALPWGKLSGDALNALLGGQLTAEDFQGYEPFSADGDLASLHDTDFYRYTTTLTSPGFTVTLETSDLSLLQAKITVLDGQGNVTDTWTAGSFSQDYSRHIDAQAARSYFFRVEGATQDNFGIGSYRLKITPDSTTQQALIDWASDEFRQALLANNDSIGAATVLARAIPVTNDRFDYLTSGEIHTATDQDFYRLRSPQATAHQTQSMVVDIWSNAGLDARVTVFDSAGTQLPTHPSFDDAGNLIAVTLDNAASNAIYYIEIQGDNSPGHQATGAYNLGVDFTTHPLVLDDFFSGTLPAGNPQTDSSPPQTLRALTVNQTQLFHFEFSVDPVAVSVETKIQIKIYRDDQSESDDVPTIDLIVSSTGTEMVSRNLLLAGGHTYYFRFVSGASNGSPTPAMTFHVKGIGLNDPVGPRLVDPDEPLPPIIPRPPGMFVDPLNDPVIISYLLAIADAYGYLFGVIPE
jgi:hypothetical protein